MIVVNIFTTIEHIRWCISNIGSNYYHFEFYQNSLKENSEDYSKWNWMYDSTHFYFRCQEDATLFKLRWL